MQLWLASHPNISYFLIFMLTGYVFRKVFWVQKLPVLKVMLIYLFLALGSFILLILQIDKLPIIQSLFLAVVLMFMVRVRYFVETRRNKIAGRNAG